MNASASPPGKQRAAVYARVSTAEQVDGTSLSTQVERCRAYIESQGWALAGEYVDEGVSGAKASRPALERLLALLRSGGLDVVVVAKLDRLGRSLRNLVTLLGELDDKRLRLVSVTESFDSATPSGRLQRNMLGSFAEYDREQIRERTTSGVIATAREGHWPGGKPPYGWRLVRDGRHTRVELEPSEAEVLRTASEMVGLQGLTMSEAAHQLNAHGWRTREGRPWDRLLLRWALSGPLGGEWRYRRASGSRRNPGEALAVIRGPEIVPAHLRSALERQLAATAKSRRPGSYPYLLSNFESLCGKRYVGAYHPLQGPGYRCRQHDRANLYKEPDCNCRRAPAELVEPLVWDALVRLLADPVKLTSLAEQWLAQTAALTGVESESLEAVERRTARLEANLARLVADYLRQGVPGDTVRLATADVTAEIERLRAYRDRLAAVAQHRATAGERASQLVEVAQEALREATPERRRRVAQLFGLHVKLLAWGECPSCHGSGKATGLGPGRRCQDCLGAKGLPVLRVTGEVDPSVLRPQADATSAPLPFAIDL